MGKNSKQSSLLGILLAPLIAPVVYVAAVFFFTPDLTPKGERTFETAFFALAAFIPCSYIMSLVLGAPLVYVLKRFNKYSLWSLVACSAPAGALAVSLLALLAHSLGATLPWRSIEFLTRMFSIGAFMGIVVAISFYCLANKTTSQANE